MSSLAKRTPELQMVQNRSNLCTLCTRAAHVETKVPAAVRTSNLSCSCLKPNVQSLHLLGMIRKPLPGRQKIQTEWPGALKKKQNTIHHCVILHTFRVPRSLQVPSSSILTARSHEKVNLLGPRYILQGYMRFRGPGSSSRARTASSSILRRASLACRGPACLGKWTGLSTQIYPKLMLVIMYAGLNIHMFQHLHGL